jgi:hypothetical protein
MQGTTEGGASLARPQRWLSEGPISESDVPGDHRLPLDDADHIPG